MRYLIFGADGYIGWALTLYLKERGHIVYGVDNFTRRQVGKSAVPIAPPLERGKHMEKLWNLCLLEQPKMIELALKESKPDCIVHLAEQPSAPYSMRSRFHCCLTHRNNVEGTLNLLHAMAEWAPEAQLIKLGSMGEYGTRNAVIPEGEFEFQYKAFEDMSGEPQYEKGSGFFPRHPGSWYHLTKVHDTHNCEFASRLWGLRITDIMQGVVFGLEWDQDADQPDELLTRFDYDEAFGTVINRFCAQAITNHPLTVYGTGGQTRGYIPLRDSLRCIELVSGDGSYSGPRYRTFNQLAEVHSVRDLAAAVAQVANVRVEEIKPPRLEELEHEYYPQTEGLAKLGYKPTINLEADIERIIKRLWPFRENINPAHFNPTTTWRPSWQQATNTDHECPSK